MMAHLLGSQACIESLRRDVTDVQESVIDVFSRVGPVRSPSWKYPDKVSADLDLTHLLEIYDFDDDEEHRQVSHIILMELVIDRLVLLLQSVSRFTDQVTAGRSLSAQQTTSNTSVGLVVKKYWNKMVTLSTTVQHLQSESRTRQRRNTDQEKTIQELGAEIERLRAENEVLSGTLNGLPIPLCEADATRLAGNSRSSNRSCISRDDCNKSSQTIETAFVPCEACMFVQKCYRETGKFVTSLCQDQGLPSSLAKHKKQVEDVDWLSSNDVWQWSSEVNKDLSRTSKHLQSLEGQIEPLTENLRKEEQRNKQLNDKMSQLTKDLQLERQTQSAQMRQFQAKLSETEKQGSEALTVIQRAKGAIEVNKKEVEHELSEARARVTQLEAKLKDAEQTRKLMEKELEKKISHDELQSTVVQLKEELSQTSQHLRDVSLSLDREKALSQSMAKHREAVQGKQGGLVKRLDELDQENSDLRDQLAELEDCREEANEAVEKASTAQRGIQCQLKEQEQKILTLENEKNNLENHVEQLENDLTQMEVKVKDMKEQQCLLVEYPDLNGPVNPDIAGTGDLATDMENQVKANTIRIQLLEQQNAKLRNSISKMLNVQRVDDTAPVLHPMPLWTNPASVNSPPSPERNHFHRDLSPQSDSPDNMAQPIPSNHSHPAPPGGRSGHCTRAARPDSGVTMYNIPQKTLSMREKSAKEQPAKKDPKKDVFTMGKGTKSRPSSALHSGKVSGLPPGGSSSISTYTKLKKAAAQQLATGGRGRPSSATKSQAPSGGGQKDYLSEVHTCSECDKTYTSPGDLQIHKSYCTGI